MKMKLNNMTQERKRMLISISVFYVIAIAIRAAAMQINPPPALGFMFLLRGWAEGLGPCIGALVAVILLGRKFFCGISGKSLVKSVICIYVAVVVPWFVVWYMPWTKIFRG